MAIFRRQAPVAVAAGMAPLTVEAASDTEQSDVTAERSHVILAFVLVIGGGALGWWIADVRHPAPFTPSPGISIFAVLYIMAQGIERIQEPFTPWLGRTKEDNKSVLQPEAKKHLEEKVAAALTGQTNPGQNPTPAEVAANAQRTVDQIRANLTMLMWGTSSFLAMVASGYFGMFLLHAVGMSAGVLPDVIVTGLAVGAGTKPLHDLISDLRESADQKPDPQETSG
jgi:hypothetical protein